MLVNNFRQTGPTQPFTYTCQIGFFAGLFWSLARFILYYCNFVHEPLSFMIKWFLPKQLWLSLWGSVLGVLSLILFSIVASLIYMLLFRKFEGPWPGLFYGVVWWALVFVLGSFIGLTHPIYYEPIHYTITELCLFIIWGLFIGFSIAFEFTDESSREPMSAH